MGAAKNKRIALAEVSDKILEIANKIPDSYEYKIKSVIMTGTEAMKYNPDQKLNPLLKYRVKIPYLSKIDHNSRIRKLLFDNQEIDPNETINNYIKSIDERNKKLNAAHVQSK